jgi:hypothetical protein
MTETVKLVLVLVLLGALAWFAKDIRQGIVEAYQAQQLKNALKTEAGVTEQTRNDARKADELVVGGQERQKAAQAKKARGKRDEAKLEQEHPEVRVWADERLPPGVIERLCADAGDRDTCGVSPGPPSPSR